MEKAPGMSTGIKDNIKTTSPKCLCSGYLSFHVNNNEYRKKITISAE
jgi:hypothetical protein